MKPQLLSEIELQKQVAALQQSTVKGYKVSVTKTRDGWQAQSWRCIAISSDVKRAVNEVILMRYNLEKEQVQQYKVDWFRLFIDIEKTGLSIAQIAKVIHVGKTTAKDWRNGLSNPKHFHGEALIDLWMLKTGKKRTDLPKEII